MQYWIHIFDDTSTIKLRSFESSYSVLDEAVSNLIADINREAVSTADGVYIVVLTAFQNFKFPANADDFIVKVNKSGAKYTII